MGNAGVHTLLKELHSQGNIFPFSTSPHLHTYFSLLLVISFNSSSKGNLFSISFSLYSPLKTNPLLSIFPSPLHNDCDSLKYLLINSLATIFPSLFTKLL